MKVIKKIEITFEEQQAVNTVIHMMNQIFSDADFNEFDWAVSEADEVRSSLEYLQDEYFICCE